MKIKYITEDVGYKRTGFLKAAGFYTGMFLASLGLGALVTGCPSPVEPEPEPEPDNYIEDESEGVDKVKQVLADNGLTVEYFNKEIRIFDPIKGNEIAFFPDLANETEGIYAEFLSDSDGFSNEQLETIQNILNGPGYPAMLATEKGYEDDIENDTETQMLQWGL